MQDGVVLKKAENEHELSKEKLISEYKQQYLLIFQF